MKIKSEKLDVSAAEESRTDETEESLAGREFDEVCEIIHKEQRQDVRVMVHRKPDAGSGRWAYCFSCQPKEYVEADLLDLIFARYGPGEYPVQIKVTKVGSKPIILWQKNYAVQAQRLGPQLDRHAPSEIKSSSADFSAVVQAMQEQTEMLGQVIRRVLDRQEQQKSTIDVLKEISQIKDLFADSRQSSLEQFKDFMELRSMIREDVGGDSGDPLSMAMRALSPAIAKGIDALQQAEQQKPSSPSPAVEPRPTPQPSPRPAAVRTAPNDTPPLPDSMQEYESIEIDQAFNFFARQFLQPALQLAETGSNPRDVAKWLARLIGDNEKLLHLIGLVISQDDMIDRFTIYSDKIAKYAAWFDRVADYLAFALWPDANDDPDAENATKNATKGDFGPDQGITAADDALSAEGNGHDDTIASGGGDDPTIDTPRSGDGNDA